MLSQFRKKSRQALGVVKAKLFEIPCPVNIGFEITHLCNLDCAYCDRHTSGVGELRTEQVLKILDEFYALGTRAISLDGGEPLARKDFPKIVGRILDLGMELRVNTNGILVPANLDLLKHASKLKISLDGDQQRHESMRGPGSFKKAIHGIEKAREHGIQVELTCVLHKQNIFYVDPLLELAEKLDAPIVFQPCRPSLYNGVNRGGRWWMAEINPIREVFARLERDRKTNKYISNRKSSLVHFQRYPSNVKLPCAAGWVNCLVDPHGYIYHCAQVGRRNLKTNVLESGVREAFRTMKRFPCRQCWCARTVEENYAWGMISAPTLL